MGSLSDTQATQPDAAFWRSQLRLSILVVIGETAVVMGYLAVTPRGQHRIVLWIMAVVFLVLGLCRIAFVPHAASVDKLRLPFSFVWAVTTIAVIAAATMLDGSLDSPLRSLLIVPVVFAGLLYPPGLVVATSLVAIAAATLVTTTDPGIGVEWHYVVIDFAVLVGVGLCSWIASLGRSRSQREAERLNHELVVLATTDPLTQCLNRRSFEERCEVEFARAVRHNRELTFMMIDVDKFKEINDSRGHVVGDRALANLGAVLDRTSRAGDVIGRLGGDEFAVLMPDTDTQGAISRARRIRKELRGGPVGPMAVSFGVSERGAEITTAPDLYAAADRALYVAKRQGGDRLAAPREVDPSQYQTVELALARAHA
jgi:diguanylate cyclase (GGDEF)-like protein